MNKSDSGAAAKRLRKNIKGINLKVPLTRKKRRRYIHFDNAASTPALESVLNDLGEFLEWYSGVHRGTGHKSMLSSRAYDESHGIIGQFLNADPERDSVIIVNNTTEAINKLSHCLQLKPSDVVISSDMEHHSNDLPWRGKAVVEYVRVDKDGMLDLEHLAAILKRSWPRVRLLTICGASNVTGHVNDIHRLAEMAHEYGARIMVDGAQLIPHCSFDMKAHTDPGHIDFVAFSGHKIFAPYGAGALIGPREVFAGSPPHFTGGGTVKVVMKKRVYWADPPDRDEAGSPNVSGTYALARTLAYLKQLGMDKLQEHEEGLTRYLLEQMTRLDGVTVYGRAQRIGVVSFNINGLPHALVGAILCYEAGIGTRTGCFCAQNYVRNLLKLEENHSHVQLYDQKRNDKIPGMVRVSLAGYNTQDEVDYLLQWIRNILENKYDFRQRYRFFAPSGSFMPVKGRVAAWNLSWRK
jgi:selenocysteine lyase/cysteine desulfurase